jgi:hypothetical protein
MARVILARSCYFKISSTISSVFRPSAGALESLALACAAQVNSREEHGQLRRLEFDAVRANRLGHLEASDLKAFVPNGKPIAVEVKDLQPIPAAVEEEKEMAGQGVLSEALLNEPGETVEAFS